MIYRSAVVIACCFAVWACASKGPPDSDAEYSKATRIVPGFLAPDSIDAAHGDLVDWKSFSYFNDAKATVTFRFGEMFKPHGVRGEITLFDISGNALQREVINPDRREFVFTFTALKDKNYFFKVEAVKGASGYTVETKVEPLDACASCAPPAVCCKPGGQCCQPGTACRDGACVKSDACSPECGSEEVCSSGRCEPACAGGCSHGKRCDVRSRRCVAVTIADHRTVVKRPACDPPCGGGEKCNEKTGECEGGTEAIAGSVLNVSDDGGGSIVQINRGAQDGVKRGATGSVGGHPLTVFEVTATRCRAKVPAKPDQLKGQKVRISK